VTELESFEQDAKVAAHAKATTSCWMFRFMILFFMSE